MLNHPPLLLIACLAGLQAFVIDVERVRRNAASCLEESKVDVAVVQQAAKGEYTDDPNLKAHLLCVSKYHGIINANGDLQNDKIRKLFGAGPFPPALVDQIVEKCAVKKETPQETAFQFMQCSYKISIGYIRTMTVKQLE